MIMHVRRDATGPDPATRERASHVSVSAAGSCYTEAVKPLFSQCAECRRCGWMCGVLLVPGSRVSY